MDSFAYKVSVIVPVYNVSEYLAVCLDSLLAQTIDPEEMEVLLINDGSTDDSFAICKKYAEAHSIFKLFSKDNEGLSATRNFGIDRARGKYLMYLDSDDTYSPETVKAVTDFFDAHYDEVDLVTFLDQPYRDGQKLPVHYRYRYLQASGVYDLNAMPYITQTRVNVCVKNMEENFYFDTTPGFRHEDQEYCSKVLMDKQRIGWCAQGEYQYNRSNEGSIVSNYFHAFYIFESTMGYFERLFAQFGETVPRYYQSMYFNDLQWKHNANILYPYHYSAEDFAHAMDRIKALLAKVDADIIYNHPMLDNFNKQYWLHFKPNAYPMVIAGEDEYGIYADGHRIYHWDRMELILHKIRVKGNDVKVMAFLKSPVYTHRAEPAAIYVVENEDREHARRLVLCDSIHSEYKSRTKTCNFYGFTWHGDSTQVHSVSFFVRLDGYAFPVCFWCMPTAVFSDAVSSYVRGNVLLTLDEDVIRLKQLSPEQAEAFEQDHVYVQDAEAAALRKKSLAYRKKHRIWLYYDLQTVEKDNGYDQFMHDIRYADGVERYYVYNRELSEIEHLFTRAHKRHLIRFGSKQHKLLYLSADKIFTAFYGFTPISPFGTEDEEAKYLDLIKAEIYYLQHGVLHADLRSKNHAERCRADKIVISTKLERRILTEHYGYEPEDLVCTGMARYDSIDVNRKPKNRILFAPSWREYLTNVLTGSSWELRKDKLTSSNYYRKFMEFLSSAKLSRLLAEYDLYLDVKLHPIIRDAKELFALKDPRICMAEDTVDAEDYRIFITDISSYVYDFVYLKRAILYFMPDAEEFASGMNHYRRLALPLEEGYGPVAYEAEDAVAALERILANGCRPEALYEERMEDVFLPEVAAAAGSCAGAPQVGCAEGLYRYVTENAPPSAEGLAGRQQDVRPVLLSVVTAVYNTAPYLKAMIESVLGQETDGLDAFCRGENRQGIRYREAFEFILVDDGSTDGSAQILIDYAARDARIRLIRQENAGVSAARNAGIAAARGRYITFPDSDDRLSPTVFADCLRFFDAHEDEIALCAYPLRFFDAQEGDHWTIDRFAGGTRIVDLQKEWDSPQYFVNSAFFKLRDLQGRLSFDEGLSIGEDTKLTYDLLLYTGPQEGQADAGRFVFDCRAGRLPHMAPQIGLVDTCTYRYRRRSAGVQSAMQESRNTANYYIPYVDRLLGGMLRGAKERFGTVPKHVQYAVMGQLQWRLGFTDRGEIGKAAIGGEAYQAYKKICLSLLREIDDDVVLAQKQIWSEHFYYIFLHKYGRKPEWIAKEDNLYFQFGRTRLPFGLADVYTCLEELYIRDGILHIEGYAMDYDPDTELVIRADGVPVPYETVQTDADKYSLDDIVMHATGFAVDLPLKRYLPGTRGFDPEDFPADTSSKRETAGFETAGEAARPREGSPARKPGCLRITFCSRLGETEVVRKPFRFSEKLPLWHGLSRSYYAQEGVAVRREGEALMVRDLAEGSAAAYETEFQKQLAWHLRAKDIEPKERRRLQELLAVRPQPGTVMPAGDANAGLQGQCTELEPAACIESAGLQALSEASVGSGYADTMRQAPLLSVIIPVYNAADSLPQTLDSVLGQSLRDIEVLCIDDGSTDGSVKILRAYAKKDTRLRLLRQSHQHAGPARNRGIEAARGKYIHFLDADDCVLDGAYEALCRRAEQYALDVLRCGALVNDVQQGTCEQDKLIDLSYVEYGDFNRYLIPQKGSPLYRITVTPWAGICRRDFLLAKKIRFNDLICVNDRAFYAALITNADRIMITRERVVLYRAGQQGSLVGTRAEHFDCHFQSIAHITARMEADGIEPSVQAGILGCEFTDLIGWAKKYYALPAGARIWAQLKAYVAQYDGPYPELLRSRYAQAEEAMQERAEAAAPDAEGLAQTEPAEAAAPDAEGLAQTEPAEAAAPGAEGPVQTGPAADRQPEGSPRTAKDQTAEAVPGTDLRYCSVRVQQLRQAEITGRILDLLTARVDVKNAKSADNDLQIYDLAGRNARIEAPDWFKNDAGTGYVLMAETVESTGDPLRFTVRCIGDGSLVIRLRGMSRPDPYGGPRHPVWIDYLQMTVDGTDVEDLPVSTCHDAPYEYRTDVHDGEIVRVELLFKSHAFGERVG